MSNMTQFQGNTAALPAVIQQAMQQMTGSELSQGVGANYAVVSIRGKVFRIKFGGVETPVMMTIPDGQGGQYQQPAAFLDVVIPRANGALSKTFYKNGFSEGSADQPDCWSEDGLTPLAPLDQRPLDMHTGQPCRDCRTCPMNQWGSKKTPAGKDIKACADTRKVAVVPAVNISNDAFGGPMLLRVPGGSLGNLAEFDRAMQAKGFPYYAVVVRLAFDADPAHPKLTFTPIRVITNEEAAQVMQLRDNDPRTLTVLGAQQAGAAGGTAPEAPAQIQHQPQAPVQMQQAFAPPQQPQQPNYGTPQQGYAPPQQPASPPQYAQPVQTMHTPQGAVPYNPSTGEVYQQAPQQPAPQAFQQPAPVQQAPVQQFTPPPMEQAPQAFQQPAPTQFQQPAPQQSFTPPPMQQEAPQQAFPTQPAPTQAFQQPAPQQAAPAAVQGPQGGAAPAADPGLLSEIDSLLGT